MVNKKVMASLIVLAITIIVVMGSVLLLEKKDVLLEAIPQTTPQKEVAVVFGKKILVDDLDNNTNPDKVMVLALMIENIMRKSLSSLYDIPVSDKVIEEWLRENNPRVLDNRVLGRPVADAKKIYEALLSIHNEQLNMDEAYSKYLKGILETKDWKILSNQFSDTMGLKVFKGELDKSYQDALKGIIERNKWDHVMDQAKRKICELEHVKDKIKSDLAKKVIQYSKHSLGNMDGMLEDKLKSYCFIYTLEELVNLQKERVHIVDSKYTGALSLTVSYQQWQFHKKVLP